MKKRIEELETVMGAPDFWNDKEAAQKCIDEVTGLKSQFQPFQALTGRIEDLEVLLELGREENDAESLAEAKTEADSITKALDQFELQQFLSGPQDKADAFLTIHAGAGGTESCDWAEMLLRMYQRWAENAGHKVDILDIQDGEGAGVRSATVHIRGKHAYGNLNCERGVHRLVRISPFDANNRRHTSFASVDVTPDTAEDIEIEVEEKDLKIDRYRSGGKGGQNVNKVETAVRLTHMPTGVVVACQNERSQPKNYNMALKLLKAKLYQLEEDKKSAELERQYGEKGEIAWGSQIRNYVFQPYQLVKDLRTGVETSNIQDVMDGGIGEFIEAKLRGLTAES